MNIGHAEAIGKLLISDDIAPLSWTWASGRTFTRELREKVLGAI